MNRTDRLNAILMHLQSKRVVTAQELAERFEISIRTVYRDIRAIEAGGVPITSEAGVGYALDKSFSLPPLHLTSEEALALLIGGKLVHDLPDQQTRDSYQSALLKVRAILPHQDKDKIERWENTIQVMPRPRAPDNLTQPENMAMIQQALLYARVVSMDYYSIYRKQHTQRRIEPIGLVYYFHQWHLIAWCQLRQDYRDFRLDRISQIELLNENFPSHQRQSIEKYLQQFQKDQELPTLKVQFHREILPYLLEYRYNMGFISEKEIDKDWKEMSFVMSDLDFFARWLLMYTDAIKVIGPNALIEKMVTLMAELKKLEKNLPELN